MEFNGTKGRLHFRSFTQNIKGKSLITSTLAVATFNPCCSDKPQGGLYQFLSRLESARKSMQISFRFIATTWVKC